jgi:hypothetical protein
VKRKTIRWPVPGLERAVSEDGPFVIFDSTSAAYAFAYRA